MVRPTFARWLRRGAPLWALAAAAALVLGQSVALAKSSHASGVSYYVIKNAKSKCKAHYTKQTVTLKVRRHHAWVHVHQVRCVYTGNRAGSSGGGIPTFPVNLPTAAVTVTAIPTAVPDSYWMSANGVLAVGSAVGVLTNDSGLGISAQLVSGAAHGTVTLDRNGAFHYTPTAGYSGVDRFSYRATDASGQNSGAAQVTIYVTPQAVAPSTYSVAAGSTLDVGAPGVLTGATGSGLQAALVAGPAHGSATVNPDGSFSYTPAGGFAGADSFQFEVVDSSGLASVPATVTIDVGASPPSVVAETFTGAVGNTELQVGGTRGAGAEVFDGSANALAGDTDPNGGSLSTTAASITTARGGTVTLAANGTFTYQPPIGFDGPTDSFTYQVNTGPFGADPGLSTQASATIDFNGARVWYVDQSAQAGGNGSSAAPFNSLAGASSAGGASASGDVVLVFPGSYGGGIALASNETLVGAPAGVTVGSEVLLAASGANPVITNASASSAGISLAGGDSVSAITVSGTAGAGISAAGANSFTIASNVTVSGAGADGIDVSGGGGDALIAATISGSAGHAVDVQSRSSGTLTFSGPVADSGDGLLLSGNSGATIDFTGLITAHTTNAHPAFEAVGGGTVAATGDANTLSASGAAALDVESTTIAAGGLDFKSISSGSSPSSGPPDGVILSNTGPGPLRVSGTQGTGGSGGTIQGTSLAALSLSNTGPVGLNELLIEPSSGDGVLASVVPALTIFNSTLTGGTAGIVASGDASTQQSAQTFDFEQDAFSGQQNAAIALTYAGTAVGYVQQSQIGSENPILAGSSNGDAIDIAPSSGGTITASVLGNKIYRVAQGNGIDAQAPSGTTLDLTLANNTIQMDSSGSQDGVVVGSSGSVCLSSSGNTVTAAGSGSGANAFEVDQLTTQSVFQIQGYDGVPSDLVSFLGSGSTNTLTTTGGGAAAVASPDGSNGFTATVSCPQPPPNSGDI